MQQTFQNDLKTLIIFSDMENDPLKSFKNKFL